MAYLIFDDVENAVGFCYFCDEILNLPKGEEPIYDHPRKHPKKMLWEVIVEDYVFEKLDENQKKRVVERLSPDWNY